jgi:hypothetical protein
LTSAANTASSTSTCEIFSRLTLYTSNVAIVVYPKKM